MAKKKIGTIILAGVLTSSMLLTGCGGTGRTNGSESANSSSTSLNISSETDREENNSDSNVNGAESVENSGAESQENSETAVEPEQIEFDYLDLVGGAEAYSTGQSNNDTYESISGSYLVLMKDGRLLTFDEADAAINGKDLVKQYLNEDDEEAFDRFMNNWAYGYANEYKALPGFDQIEGVLSYSIYKVRSYNEKYADMLFADASIQCDVDCPDTVEYEGKKVPVVGVEYRNINYGDRNIIVPEFAQSIVISDTTFNDIDFKSNKTQIIHIHDCRCGKELHITNDPSELYMTIFQNEGAEALTIPENGSVKYLYLYRNYDMKSLNSTEDGVYRIPEGVTGIDIMQNPKLVKILLPETLKRYDLSSNDNLKVMSYKGTDYTDMAELQVAVGNNSVGDDMSMEIEGIVEDIRNLDADEANKNGQEFSFIGKDYWQNNIFYTVWYENGYWRVKLDISEGGRDIHTTGYFDSDFVYHNS